MPRNRIEHSECSFAKPRVGRPPSPGVRAGPSPRRSGSTHAPHRNGFGHAGGVRADPALPRCMGRTHSVVRPRGVCILDVRHVWRTGLPWRLVYAYSAVTHTTPRHHYEAIPETRLSGPRNQREPYARSRNPIPARHAVCCAMHSLWRPAGTDRHVGSAPLLSS